MSLSSSAPASLSCLQVFCGSWLVPWSSRGLPLGSSALSPADFFQGKHFFLYGEFPGEERRKLSRYVTAFSGSVSAWGEGCQAQGRGCGRLWEGRQWEDGEGHVAVARRCMGERGSTGSLQGTQVETQRTAFENGWGGDQETGQ